MPARTRRPPRTPARTFRAALAAAALAAGAAASAPAQVTAPDTAGRVAAAPASAARPAYRVAAEYGHVSFDTLFSPWNLASASLSRKTPGLAVIGTLNFARRFAESAFQGEVEAYPKLSPKAYAYLEAAYAASGSFPRWRGGGELYLNLPGAWETSAGIRQLHFTTTDVSIFTGSVGKYQGPYYMSLRPYVSRSEGETGRSGFLTVRRYGATGDEFAGVVVGYGSSPVAVSTLAEVLRGNTFHLGADVSRSIARRTGIKWAAEYEHEALPAGGTRNRVGFTVGLRRDL